MIADLVGIVVHKLDRFSRDKCDSAFYKQKLKENRVRLISLTENLDGTPESIIVESVIDGIAQRSKESSS